LPVTLVIEDEGRLADWLCATIKTATRR